MSADSMEDILIGCDKLWKNVNYNKISRLFKKKNGSADAVIMSLLALLALSVLFVFTLSNYEPIIKYGEAQNICRQYMLKAEEDGYLTSTNENNMLQKLQDVGINNADLSGTTLTQVTYGQDVTININFTVKVRTLTVGSSIIPKFDYESKNVNISRTSTSTRVIQYTN